jgi:hypothetical protein
LNSVRVTLKKPGYKMLLSDPGGGIADRIPDVRAAATKKKQQQYPESGE